MKLIVLFTLFILGSSTKLEGWYDDKLNPMPPFEDMEEEILENVPEDWINRKGDKKEGDDDD